MPRPSSGCYVCRRRRIKCDERRGGCLNCERYGVLCPGYPDQFDASLRLRLAKGEKVWDMKAHPSSAVTTSGASTHFPPQMPIHAPRTRPVIEAFPYPDSDGFKLAVFFQTQCIDGQIENWSVERMQSCGNGCLFAAIKTLSSTEVEKRNSLPNDSNISRSDYIEAIRLLNAALASPLESSQDSTLLATLIMSTIEMTAAPNQSSSYWKQHAEGAAALLQIRGAKQVTSTVGAALYFQVSSLLITSCILGKRAVPFELEQLRNVICTFLIDETHPLWRHQEALIHFTNFYAQVTKTTAYNTSRTISKAFEIYQKLLLAFETDDVTWQYRTLPSWRFPGLLDYEHCYRSVIASQVWNSHRAAVLLLCILVAGFKLSGTDEMALADEVRHFMEDVPRITNQTALDTLAAIPRAADLMVSKQNQVEPLMSNIEICHTGYGHHNSPFKTMQTTPGTVPYMHGCHLQWAVFFGVQSSLIRLDVRKCLWTVLESAGRKMNNRQWQDLSQQLRPMLQDDKP